ncbi:hypothetical protein V495_00015 [Pseudogymnoascus sp. VKM F-4514 (FW-929)]|nr:hypothetical protein V495_00015 [Pseudogymnoascus sp. VKM F-4514 (FW-929)]KFY66149.1 hypothetical protein V497_01102 [Pseudogymnoascus sp. VKM F-4516 (FW-969)]
MKLLILLAHLLAANLIFASTGGLFHHVALSCDASTIEHPRCLRGQICAADGLCQDEGLIARQALRPRQTDTSGNSSEPAIRVSPGNGSILTGAQSLDGRCGNLFSMLTLHCDTIIIGQEITLADNKTCQSDYVRGPCCSMHGFCGLVAQFNLRKHSNPTFIKAITDENHNSKLKMHCGKGCQGQPGTQGCEAQPQTVDIHTAELPQASHTGRFEIVGRSGVPVMHAALLPNGRVMFIDKLENYTQLTLPNGQYAYSAEYDPILHKVLPLAYKTNAFCAGGAFLANGTLLTLGGDSNFTDVDATIGDGWDAIRYLTRLPHNSSLDGHDWYESADVKLNSKRWYPSAQIMGDGTIFVASGNKDRLNFTDLKDNNPTYEILDRDGRPLGPDIDMDILLDTNPYFLYPFIHLLPDSNLFIFSAQSSQIFNVSENKVIKKFPELDGDFRTYPNTGGSVLLPLSSQNNWVPSVLICGGGVHQNVDSATDSSCGRINPLDKNASWEMDYMDKGRTMVEGTLLPDGTVAFMNGAGVGAQGYAEHEATDGLARMPNNQVLIYNASESHGQRFKKDAISTVNRMYHSVTVLLLDGTVLVAGSNVWEWPVLQQTDQADPSTKYSFPTEFRVEIYTPPYLIGPKKLLRPSNVILGSTELKVMNNSTFLVEFSVPRNATSVTVSLSQGGFSTHSLHMGSRMIMLDTTGFKAGLAHQQLVVKMPSKTGIAPPGPYVVYVLADGIPSVGQFVLVS